MTERQKDQVEPAQALVNDIAGVAASAPLPLPASHALASEKEASEEGVASADAVEASREAAKSARRNDGPLANVRGWIERRVLLGNSGNPLRVRRGGLTAALGGIAAFTLMAAETQLRWGILLGLIAVMATTFGVLDFLGTFDDAETNVARRTTLRGLAGPLTGSFVAFAATIGGIAARVQGHLSVTSTAVIVTGSFAALIVAIYRTGVALGPWASDETGYARPIYERHGFWVVLTATLLYLPMMGSFSLIDPWETHYGEVAREMLSRNDWISTWWATEGWFWSKPVLDFWLQGLSMGLFGVDWRAGRMLAPVDGNTPWPEWATRMPVFVMTIVALYFLYKGVAKVYGRRAGMLGALVLATMPQWFLLAHQTMTDMPLVAALSATMGLLLLGMHTDGDVRVKAYEVAVGKAKWRLTGFHLVFGVILMTALPQIFYLWSRNAEVSWFPDVPGFRFHFDEFNAGSKGNCGLPGNDACHSMKPAFPGLQPLVQGHIWAAFLGIVLYLNWGERRAQRLYFLAAWYFAAVATMGKGPAGFGLPLCVTFLYVAVTRKWTKLLVMEVTSGLLLIGAVALPWYVAMYVRHGSEFTDRLIFHDMYKRAMVHVHDTNEGDDVSFRFYIWQLGYALFPWTGLAPAALAWWARRRDDAAEGQGDVAVFLSMWFVFAFGLFTAVLTKFHHYIFPAVPPIAMLTGILVDRMMGEGRLWREGDITVAGRTISRGVVYLLGLGGASVFFLYGLSRFFPGSVTGTVFTAGPALTASPVVATLLVAAGTLVAVVCVRKFGANAESNAGDSRTSSHENLMLGSVAVAGAILLAIVGRDLAAKNQHDIAGQARLMHLFSYNYGRQLPEQLDFGSALAAFAIFATVLCGALAWRRARRHIVVLFSASALLFAAWGVDFYLPRAAPHWGQREVIETYFKMRKSDAEPIIAYHMDWKGEIFYSGNHIAAFTAGGPAFANFVKGEQAKGVKTFWIVSDHGRATNIKNEIGASVKSFDVLTDRALNKNFCLSRAILD